MPNNKPNNNQGKRPPRQKSGSANNGSSPLGRGASRGAAIRAQKRTHDDAQRVEPTLSTTAPDSRESD